MPCSSYGRREPGDLLLFAADKNKVVYDVLVHFVWNLQNRWIFLTRTNIVLWVTEFPLLEWSEEAEPFHSNAPSIYNADGRGYPSTSTVIREEFVQKHTISY